MTSDDRAYVFAWLRHFGGALAKGRRALAEELADGRAIMTVEYPSLAELLEAERQVGALVAMVQEDALSVDEELHRIVRDYHSGDGGGE